MKVSRIGLTVDSINLFFLFFFKFSWNHRFILHTILAVSGSNRYVAERNVFNLDFHSFLLFSDFFMSYHHRLKTALSHKQHHFISDFTVVFNRRKISILKIVTKIPASLCVMDPCFIGKRRIWWGEKMGGPSRAPTQYSIIIFLYIFYFCELCAGWIRCVIIAGQ